MRGEYAFDRLRRQSYGSNEVISLANLQVAHMEPSFTNGRSNCMTLSNDLIGGYRDNPSVQRMVMALRVCRRSIWILFLPFQAMIEHRKPSLAQGSIM